MQDEPENREEMRQAVGRDCARRPAAEGMSGGDDILKGLCPHK